MKFQLFLSFLLVGIAYCAPSEDFFKYCNDNENNVIGIRQIIRNVYDKDALIEYNKDLEYYKDKEGKKVFRLLVCSNCVSCENKKIVFRTRDANSSINIMKLTQTWIETQERPLCFSQVTQISSFTSSSKNKEDEKVRPSQVKFLLLILHFFLFFCSIKWAFEMRKGVIELFGAYFGKSIHFSKLLLLLLKSSNNEC